jgi:hypothetical protein
MEQWRTDGFGADVLELWVIGANGSEGAVAQFTEGATAPCFTDDASGTTFSDYDAQKDDLFIVNVNNTLHDRSDLFVTPLSKPENRDALDTQVRGLML